MNKEKIIQFCLIAISVFTILEFYQHDIPLGAKAITTIFLVVIDCVYNYRIGMKDGIKISNRHNERMKELREESFNKIVDMVVEEKTNDKAME